MVDRLHPDDDVPYTGPRLTQADLVLLAVQHLGPNVSARELLDYLEAGTNTRIRPHWIRRQLDVLVTEGLVNRRESGRVGSAMDPVLFTVHKRGIQRTEDLVPLLGTLLEMMLNVATLIPGTTAELAIRARNSKTLDLDLRDLARMASNG